MNGFRPIDNQLNSLSILNIKESDQDKLSLPEINYKKDLIKPIKNKSDLTKYKKDDLIKIHEFRRENIVEPYKEIQDKDFFKFTTEDDPKYKFLNVQYMLRSKLLIRSIIWSFGIGCAFFVHRYIRKQQFRNALRWGVASWSLSMFFIWGSSELQPHVVAIFHSQFIRDLSSRDQIKYKQINKMKQEKMYMQQYYDDYGINVKCDSVNIDLEIPKISLDYENITLKNFNYKQLNTEKIIKDKEEKQSHDEENEVMAELSIEPDNEYDFSFYNKLVFGEKCVINTKQFFELEKKLDKNKLEVLKDDVLSNADIVNIKNLLQAELIFAEKYLDGLYNDLSQDPDYKNY
jgi:hypothetical protein